MTTPVNRWLFLLAGAGLSPRDIRDICAWLKSRSPDEVVRVVSRLRQQDIEDLLGARDEQAAHRNSTRSGNTPDVRLEIERILRREAKLTARAAATILAEEVAKTLKTTPSISHADRRVPTYGKESFQAYLTKLLRVASPQLLLHVAHRVRSEIVHGPATAWPLKG